MVVTLTVIEAAADRRLGNGVVAPAEPINGILSRYLATATALVEDYAAGAPENVQNTAASMLVGYFYDAPVSQGPRYANALANSGAQLVLSRWQSRRIAIVDGDGAVAAVVDVPTEGGLDAAQVQSLIDAAIAGLDIPALVAQAVAGGGAPPQTVNVPVSTAQLQTLDTDYVELIPAPGIGQFVQVLQVWIHKFGDADPLETGTETSVANINAYGEYAMLFVADDTPAKPWNYSTGNYESVWVSNFGDLLRLPDSSIVAGVIGGHGLGENQPLVLGFTPGLPGVRNYTPAGYDEFIGPVNDAILTVFLRYAVHSIYQFA